MSGKFQIKSIARLEKGINGAGRYLGDAASSQVESIQNRLTVGHETNGNPFDPYKDPSRYHQQRPLMKAARLFEGAQITTSTSGDTTTVKATISGLPARIAYFQNKMREFLGYSSEDRREAVTNYVKAIRKAAK